MIICLGPICIPLWGLLPFVTMFIGVVWQRIKQWLGYATAAAKSSPAAAVEPSAPPAVDSKAPAALAANLVQRKPKVTYENSGHVPAPQGVVVVRDSDHWRTLLDSASNEGYYVLAYFTAQWCGPCKAMQPTVEAAGKSQLVQVLKVDVDNCQDVAEEMRVSAMPTFKIHRNGAWIAEKMGAMPQGQFESWLKQTCV